MFVQYENRAFPYSASVIDNLTFLLHLHRQAELLLVLAGEIEMTVDAHTQTLTAGQLGFAFPNCAHSYMTRRNSRVLLLIFDAALAGDCASALLTQRASYPFLAAQAVDPDIHYLAPKLLRPMETRLMKGYLQVICARLLERMPVEAQVAGDASDWTHRALTYLNEHFTEPIALDDLARHLNISKYHLCRAFPEKIGCGLSAYLKSLRADHAAQLLASTDVSITQAGYDSGFESSSTFFRVFKQCYGLSPRAYRASKRAQADDRR